MARPNRKTIAGVQPEKLAPLQMLIGRHQLAEEANYYEIGRQVMGLAEKLTQGESA